LAPSGDYRVTVSACNIYDLCSEKTAKIKIPWIAVILPIESVPTQQVKVERPEANMPVVTAIPPVVESTSTHSEIRADSKVGVQPRFSALSWIVLISLMWVISSAALSDKRPMAIRAIAKTISTQNIKENR
jgi:hypothetical protein